MEGDRGLQPGGSVIDCELSLGWNVAGQSAIPAKPLTQLLAFCSAGSCGHCWEVVQQLS